MRIRSPDEQIFEFVFERKKSPSADTEPVRFESSPRHTSFRVGREEARGRFREGLEGRSHIFSAEKIDEPGSRTPLQFYSLDISKI